MKSEFKFSVFLGRRLYFQKSEKKYCFFVWFNIFVKSKLNDFSSMSTKRSSKVFSLLFFTIFMVKMFIATAPIYVNFSDNEHIINVIMQLELEGKGQTGIDGVKEIVSANQSHNFNLQVEIAKKAPFPYKKERDITYFFPSVPTPPPNC
jgi:hypothetical protein